MKQRQVLIRLSHEHQWEHGMIAYTAHEAWEGMMLARARGFDAKTQVMGSRAVATPLEVTAR